MNARERYPQLASGKHSDMEVADLFSEIDTLQFRLNFIASQFPAILGHLENLHMDTPEDEDLRLQLLHLAQGIAIALDLPKEQS